MTSFKKTSLTLVLALGLLGACGSDSNGTTTKDDAGTAAQDSGTASSSDGAAEGRACKGGYTGYTDVQITNNIKDDKAACANAVDIQGVCAKKDELDPAGVAKSTGLTCFLAFNGNTMLSDAEKKAKIADCTLNGTDSTDGLVMTLKPMSEKCLTCYVDTVLCAVQNCAADCGSDPNSAACDACRTKYKCTSTFYTCSGLPTSDELKAAK